MGWWSSLSLWETTLDWDMVVSRLVRRFWSLSSMLHYTKAQVLSLSWFSLEAHCERLSGMVAQRAECRKPVKSPHQRTPRESSAASGRPVQGESLLSAVYYWRVSLHSLFPPSCSPFFHFLAPFLLCPLKISLAGSSAS